MSKHTPGPWTIENPEQSIGSIDSVPTGNRVGQAFEVSVKDRNSGNPQRVANARLMAAAPTYYEAGVEFRAYESTIAAGDDVAAMVHFARASELIAEAHAKATGAQP